MSPDLPQEPETSGSQNAGRGVGEGRQNLPADPATSSVEVVGTRDGSFGVHGPGDTTGYAGLVTTVVMPGATPRPFGGVHDEIADALEAGLKGSMEAAAADEAIEKVVIHRGEMTVFVRRRHLVEVAKVLRDDPDLRFEWCGGVSGVHFPDDRDRELHAVYHLLSMTHNRRLRLEVVAPDSDPTIPSLVAVYPTNDWHERETWDFFGIVFTGHPALTRIQMPDDWPGHPQRKDYPLGGIPVEYKGGTVPPPDQRRSYN